MLVNVGFFLIVHIHMIRNCGYGVLNVSVLYTKVKTKEVIQYYNFYTMLIL